MGERLGWRGQDISGGTSVFGAEVCFRLGEQGERQEDGGTGRVVLYTVSG